VCLMRADLRAKQDSRTKLVFLLTWTALHQRREIDPTRRRTQPILLQLALNGSLAQAKSSTQPSSY
jgi:hypothetical protein